MKKLTTKIVIGVFVVIVIAFTVISCDENKDNNENPGGVYLTGTYTRYTRSQYTYNDSINFTKTSFSSTNRNGTFLGGTYKYDGAVLTLIISGIKHNKYAHLQDGYFAKTLTISGDGVYSEFFNGTWALEDVFI
ncbi:MAG: hypothetical protein LBV17_01600 [Treponema sp.]|nr:hypothetical protein [Treponema sp.]